MLLTANLSTEILIKKNIKVSPNFFFFFCKVAVLWIFVYLCMVRIQLQLPNFCYWILPALNNGSAGSVAPAPVPRSSEVKTYLTLNRLTATNRILQATAKSHKHSREISRSAEKASGSTNLTAALFLYFIGTGALSSHFCSQPRASPCHIMQAITFELFSLHGKLNFVQFLSTLKNFLSSGLMHFSDTVLFSYFMRPKSIAEQFQTQITVCKYLKSFLRSLQYFARQNGIFPEVTNF